MALLCSSNNAGRGLSGTIQVDSGGIKAVAESYVCN